MRYANAAVAVRWTDRKEDIMSWSESVLVVANRTADTDELYDAVLARAARSPIRVTLLVPGAWEVGDPPGSQQASRRRLRSATARLRDSGVAVQGVLGDGDPIAAVQSVWDPDRFDEVIVCTLPATVSRWLRIDLPHRVERLTGAPVTHVTADIGRAIHHVSA